MKKITLSMALIVFGLIPQMQSQSIATYDIVFTSTWNASEHTNAMDNALPASAHWSKLVGVNHNADVTFFEVGQMATFGIELIAESGTNDQFRFVDVQNAIDASDAEQYINGPSLSTATGTMTISGLEVSDEYPLLTILSMVAPSPDWFIGLSGYNLQDGSGNWKSSVTIPMSYVYDAGTDSGSNYTSGNNDVDQPITVFDMSNTMEPFNGNSIGFITITLTNVLSIDETESLSTVSVFPNPSYGNITISNSDRLELIEIYNLLGARVKSIRTLQEPNLELNLSGLDQGMYIIKMTDSSGNSKSQKLVLK